jgi:hypothetical protein
MVCPKSVREDEEDTEALIGIIFSTKRLTVLTPETVKPRERGEQKREQGEQKERGADEKQKRTDDKK